MYGVGLGKMEWDWVVVHGAVSGDILSEVGVRWSGNGLGVIEGTKSSKVQQSRV